MHYYFAYIALVALHHLRQNCSSVLDSALIYSADATQAAAVILIFSLPYLVFLTKSSHWWGVCVHSCIQSMFSFVILFEINAMLSNLPVLQNTVNRQKFLTFQQILTNYPLRCKTLIMWGIPRISATLGTSTKCTTKHPE